MSEHVCPWWLGYLLVSPIRRWMQNPDELIDPYVTPGMTVLEPGPGMGFFTLPLARRVGSGRVIAVDIQPKMLDRLRRRAIKAGLIQRIETRLSKPDSLAIDDLKGKVDFFREAARALAPSGRVLFAEPAGHVNESKFAQQLNSAAKASLKVSSRPEVKRFHAAVLGK